MQPIQQLPFVADDPALDFVNTAEERGHPEAGDVLLTPADLRLWGQRYGLLAQSASLGAEADAELATAREARELLYDLFLARTQGRAPTRRRLARLAQLSAEAYRAASLQPAADGSVGWRWSSGELATVRHVAVTRAVGLLQAEPSPRLKQCPGDHCGWFFLDTTKRGNRRWCRMSECGQEAKDERRRLRRQGSGRGERA
jgi:predicted RNA-binding Zn ribbon-like protein